MCLALTFLVNFPYLQTNALDQLYYCPGLRQRLLLIEPCQTQLLAAPPSVLRLSRRTRENESSSLRPDTPASNTGHSDKRSTGIGQGIHHRTDRAGLRHRPDRVLVRHQRWPCALVMHWFSVGCLQQHCLELLLARGMRSRKAARLDLLLLWVPARTFKRCGVPFVVFLKGASVAWNAARMQSLMECGE